MHYRSYFVFRFSYGVDGDVVEGLDQICVAEGQAAIAATAIHNELIKRDR
jgi:hypothetical protein